MENNQKVIKRTKIRIDTHQPYGKVLEQLMERDRWTGAKLAREVGCTRNHISEIISGKCFPSFTLGMKIASVFGYELAWRKIPAIPRSPKKKKEAPVQQARKESVSSPQISEPKLAEETHSKNGSTREKLQELKELQDKTSALRKDTEE